MKRSLKQWLIHLGAFLSRVSWISVILGAAVGVPMWWTIQAFMYPKQNQPLQVGEFALGILLGGLMGWIIPEAINTGKHAWYVSHPIRKVLGAACSNDEATVIFLASLYPKDALGFLKSVPLRPEGSMVVAPKHGMPWILVEDDARALGFIMAMLAVAGKSEHLAIVRDDYGLEITDANMICIGSPKSNYKSKQINEAFQRLPLRFEQIGDTSAIHASEPDHDLTWESDATYDYAVLAKVPNEYQDGKVVFIIAGISHPGTAGAAYFFWRKWPEIATSHNSDFFALVLKVRRDNFQYVELVRAI